MRSNPCLLLLLIIAASQLSFAECVSATKTLYVPAVVGENRSEMVKVSVETLPGKGEAFASVFPAVGFDTQGSERTAAARAFQITGVKDCDVLFRISAPNVEQVDGPSAGGAMTLLMLSALTGTELRGDFSMTGTIEGDGAVGPVGGVPLKAEAVAKAGIKLFLTPKLSSGETIEILLLKRYYNITVAQVGDAMAAFNITTSNAAPEERFVLDPDKTANYSNASIDHWYVQQLRGMAEDMIGRAESRARSADLTFRANFESRLANAQAALDAEQLYTAANTAFILAIDEDFANFTKENVKKEYDSTSKCISGFKEKNLTLQNFEVIGPAEARLSWAETRLPGGAPDNNGFVASMFDGYYSTLYAKYWCAAANDLNSYPRIGNETAFDSELLRNYTDEVLNEVNADSVGMESNSDVTFHLDAAENSFGKGQYVASLVDAAYVQSYIDVANVSAKESNATLERMLEKNYAYIWPQVLRNHAALISADDKASGLRIAFLAYELNRYFSDVKGIASGATPALVLGGGNATNGKITNESLNMTTSSARPADENAPISPVGWILIILVAITLYLGYKRGRSKRSRR